MTASDVRGHLAHVTLKAGLQARGRAPSTVDTYLRSLRAAAGLGLDLDQVVAGTGPAARTIDAYRQRRVSEGRGARAKDSRMLNALCNALYSAGILDALLSWPPPRAGEPLRVALSPDQIQQACRFEHRLPDFQLRNQAIVEVALTTGASRTEMSRLRLQDVRDGIVYIQGAKGHMTAHIPVEHQLYRDDGPLRAWLRIRQDPVDRPDALWTTLKRPVRALRPAGVYQALKAVSRGTQVPLTFNITRHTRGRRLFLAGWRKEFIRLALRLHSEKAVDTYTEISFSDLFAQMLRLGGPWLEGDPTSKVCPTCKQPVRDDMITSF